MTSHVLLTGATGLVGSSLARGLLRDGAVVHALVRGREVEARGRLQRTIAAMDPEFRLEGQACEVLDGDITRPGCGLAPAVVTRLRGTIDEVWHCAASVRFAVDGGAAAEETRTVNLAGTRNVLGLAVELGAPACHHVSTAYVAGFHEGRFGEGDHARRGRIFKNAYEQSKLEAEHLVHRYPGPWSIYRPSIIVGDSRSGRTPTFTGFYRLASSFHTLRQRVERRVRAAPAADDSGIRRDAEERLHLPVVLPCGSRSTVNLVPIDWVVGTMLRLRAAASPSGKVFHLTHPSPPPTRWIVEQSGRVLGIEGLRFAEPYVLPTLLGDPTLVHADPALQAVQRGLVERLAAYLGYLSQEPEFDDANLRAALQGAYVPPPTVTEAFLQRLLAYAVQRRFREA